MGYYINPTDGRSKEEWLAANAKGINIAEPAKHRDGDLVAVCLVDNGWMTAAGIAYDQREFEMFTLPQDHRPKRWFMVPIDKLTPFLKGQEIAP